MRRPRRRVLNASRPAPARLRFVTVATVRPFRVTLTVSVAALDSLNLMTALRPGRTRRTAGRAVSTSLLALAGVRGRPEPGPDALPVLETPRGPDVSPLSGSAP